MDEDVDPLPPDSPDCICGIDGVLKLGTMVWLRPLRRSPVAEGGGGGAHPSLDSNTASRHPSVPKGGSGLQRLCLVVVLLF